MHSKPTLLNVTVLTRHAVPEETEFCEELQGEYLDGRDLAAWPVVEGVRPENRLEFLADWNCSPEKQLSEPGIFDLRFANLQSSVTGHGL